MKKSEVDHEEAQARLDYARDARPIMEREMERFRNRLFFQTWSRLEDVARYVIRRLGEHPADNTNVDNSLLAMRDLIDSMIVERTRLRVRGLR